MRRPLALCAALLVLPLASYLGLTGVGSHRMFTRPFQYRLRITAYEHDGLPVSIAPRALAPHLGRDARRVIAPAGDFTTGETTASLLPDTLDEIADLVCAGHRGAAQVEVQLDRRTLDGTPLAAVRHRTVCATP